MKKLLASLLIAAASTGAYAADTFNNPDNHSMLGFRLNYDLTCPTEVTVDEFPGSEKFFGNGSGFSAELFYNIPLWRNLYFEPAAGLFYNTVSFTKSFERGSNRQFGMRIPLNLGYRFDLLDRLSISVFTGPELDFALFNRAHYKSLDPDYVGSSKRLNSADIKWRFGVGATFAGRYSIQISGAAGITNMCAEKLTVSDSENTQITKTYDMKMRTNLFTISLGYLF